MQIQKSTIFLIALTVVTLSVTAKIAFDSQVKNGWANVLQGQDQSEIVVPEDQSPVSPVETYESPVKTTDSSSIPASTTASNSTLKPTEVQKLLEDIKLSMEKITNDQVQTAGFKNAKIEKSEFQGRVFQSVDMSDIANARSGEFKIADNANVYALAVEMQFQTSLEATDVYSLSMKRMQGMPGISAKETNQFGDNSFFMNDPKRLSYAFLVVKKENHVYFYTYPKTNHEFIKNLISLLNQ